jgi:hypothetical protein
MVQNNLASIEFLLYGRRGLPVKLADELYARDPQHPAYAATYAFGLHLAGRSQDALVIVARIAPQHLARPELRLYHALFLAACGRIDEARERARGLEERMFLPEEWALLRATLPGTEEAPETPAPAPPPTRAPAPGT